MDSVTTFTPRARIAGICSNKAAFADLTKKFHAAGYAFLPAKTARHADLCVIDLRFKQISAKIASVLTKYVRRTSPECSFFFLVSTKADAATRKALRRYGEVIPAGREIDHVISRCRQMLRLRNVAEETGERLKTLASLNRLAEFPSLKTSTTPPRVLVAGNPGAAAISAVNAINGCAEKCVCVFSVGQAMRALDHEDFDCVVVLPEGEHHPLLTLVKALQKNSKYCCLPTVCIAPTIGLASIFAQRGAKDVILAEHVSQDLESKIQLTARRARLTTAMHAFMRSCEGESVRDPLSGAFTPLFLAEHGAKVCSRADQAQRNISIILVKLGLNSGKDSQGTLDRKALHQAARLMNRVTRADDIVARIAPDTFMFLVPATTEQDADAIALRLQGVLEHTAFRNEEDQNLYSVNAVTSVFARTPGTAIEEVVAEGMKLLRATKRKTLKAPLLRSLQ